LAICCSSPAKRFLGDDQTQPGFSAPGHADDDTVCDEVVRGQRVRLALAEAVE
jgi:hypothetical protein